ncbi:MAG: hypothetical protein WD469_06695 [Paenibacillaceae bacterium]
MKIVIPLNNLDAIQQIHDLLVEKHVSWLVGGSCGLLLQGVAIAVPPRDLDLYVDAESAIVVHEALQVYATDQLLQSQTGIYKSLLSHYQIANVSIEVVGGFEVHAQNSHYKVEVNDFLEAFGVSYEIKDRQIGLMPLAHELVFNMLRQRPDRYRAIVEKMRMNPGESFIPLNKILERNTFSTEFVNRLNELL